MNPKLLLFSGVVTMFLGAGLGAILATVLPTPYMGGIYLTEKFYVNQKAGFMLIGATGGFLFGVGIEAMRELKEQRDREENGP